MTVPVPPGPLVLLPLSLYASVAGGSPTFRIGGVIAAMFISVFVLRCLAVRICLSTERLSVRNPFRSYKVELSEVLLVGLSASTMPYRNGLVLTVRSMDAHDARPIKVAATASMSKETWARLTADLKRASATGGLRLENGFDAQLRKQW